MNRYLVVEDGTPQYDEPSTWLAMDKRARATLKGALARRDVLNATTDRRWRVADLQTMEYV